MLGDFDTKGSQWSSWPREKAREVNQVDLRPLGTSWYGVCSNLGICLLCVAYSDHKLFVLFRDAGAAADKKLKPANSVKVRHILCEKQSKVCFFTSSPASRLTIDCTKFRQPVVLLHDPHSKRAKQGSRSSSAPTG